MPSLDHDHRFHFREIRGIRGPNRPNALWSKLPMFDRTWWKRVRFGDAVENPIETCNPAAAGLERFVVMEHLELGSLRARSWGNAADGTTFTRRRWSRQP